MKSDREQRTQETLKEVVFTGRYGTSKTSSRHPLKGSNSILSTRRWLVALVCWLGFSLVNVLAQTDFVTIDGYRVHPTRIIAKYKSSGGVSAQGTVVPSQLNTMGVTEQRRVGGGAQRLAAFGIIGAPPLSGFAVPADEVSNYRQMLQDRISQMRESGLFEYVQPDYLVKAMLEPTDEAFVDGRLWGLRNVGQNGGKLGADIDAVRAWDLTTGSTNVVVAVIDTGIRYTHQDLTNQMWVNVDEIPDNGIDDDGNDFIDDIHGINAIIGTGDPMDDGDHGTHVAGTIGAAANNGYPHVGVAWEIQLMGCKFLAEDGFGSTFDAITCIYYAVDNGAHILNNSWGGGPFDIALLQAIAYAQNAGVLFVVAAGNEQNNNDAFPSYPSSYALDNMISVAALDRNDFLANFSNYGSTSVHLGAPGVSIFSTFSGSDSQYDTIQGTSMAAPHVSGVAALVKSLYPLAPLSEIRDRLLLSVVPVSSLLGVTTTGGRVNAFNALTISGGPNLSLSVDPPSGSRILAENVTPMFVEVTSLFAIPDATVTGTVSGVTNYDLTFLNDGTGPDFIANDGIYSADILAPDVEGDLIVTLVASATNKVTRTNTVVYTVVAPPANDDFVNGIKMSSNGGTFGANNQFATLEVGEPEHAGLPFADGSLWWIWTAPATGPVFVDTAGSTIDTVLGVYRGNSVIGLTEVASSDGVGGLGQAHVSFNATNGLTYRIAVASAGRRGSIRLRLTPNGQLDTQAPAVVITSPLSGITVNTSDVLIGGTAADSEPNLSGISEVLVSLNGEIGLWANGTTNWNIFLRLREGRNVIVARAIDFAGNVSPPSTIEARYQPNDPVNDHFANAILITGSVGTATANNTNAGKEVGEPHHAGNAGGKSAWWRFVPPSDGVLTLSTEDSTFDTLLALYTTNSGAIVPRLMNLVEVASNDDNPGGGIFSTVEQAVSGNQTYWIAVDGFDAVSGEIALAYGFAASTLHQVTVMSSSGGSVNFSSGLVSAGTSLTLEAAPDNGFEFAGWSGSITSGDNPLVAVVNSDLTLTATFQPVGAISGFDGFESGSLTFLPWVSSGGAGWKVQTNKVSSGTFAAQAGTIGNAQQSSLMVTWVHNAAGIGSFDYNVSSENNWDWLEFYVNGALHQRWSGEVGWQTHLFAMAAGTNTFEWRYVKDFSLSAGLDTAFVDNVDLRVVPPMVTVAAVPGGGKSIQLQGQPNRSYVIQASTDLVNWLPIATNTTVTGAIQINDPAASSFSSRFYRATLHLP